MKNTDTDTVTKQSETKQQFDSFYVALVAWADARQLAGRELRARIR